MQVTDQTRSNLTNWWNYWLFFIIWHPRCKFQLHIMSGNPYIVCINKQSQFAHVEMSQIISKGLPKCFSQNFDQSFKMKTWRRSEDINNMQAEFRWSWKFPPSKIYRGCVIRLKFLCLLLIIGREGNINLDGCKPRGGRGLKNWPLLADVINE